jgi:GntR family transcriptional regulator, transcriptional repressor for pyruvate dehydrogenase complex
MAEARGEATTRMEHVSRTPPLAYRVAEIIRSHIVEQRLSAGDQLPSEREFAERLGVSRNVIREALRALELSGLIHKRQGKGAFVRAFDPAVLARQMSFGIKQDGSGLTSLLEARVALESAAMNLVVRHATEADLEELDGLVDAMHALEEAGLPVMAEDLAFHQALLRATHNEPFNRFSGVIAEWMELSTTHTGGETRAGRRMSTHHRPIVDALRRGDAARARRLIEDHIELTGLDWNQPDAGTLLPRP